MFAIITNHPSAVYSDTTCGEDQGPTDSLGVPVSVSAAADPDLASRYSRAEVTEVTRIYEEDNTNTATATARPHSCCTDTVSTVCLVPLTPLFSEYQSPALFASITIYSVIFTSCPTKSLTYTFCLQRKKTIFIAYILVLWRHYLSTK